ncbi:MAG TPA: hypothetical protein PKW98_19430, partial [Candidatus Wallbacteria bacterium]|nr:hypothetical protein [Candidatus Wallbacteria bacterium]
IAKGPYIYLNKPFVEGAELDTLIKELGLHKALDAIFKFPIMWLVAVQKRICISTFRLDLINHLLQVLSKTQVRMKYHNRNLGGHFDVRCS